MEKAINLCEKKTDLYALNSLAAAENLSVFIIIRHMRYTAAVLAVDAPCQLAD